MSMLFRKASRSDFALHKPLPWPLYDSSGALLLRQGYVISMPSLVSRLVDRGCFIGPTNSDAKRVQLHDGIQANNESADKKTPVDDNGVHVRRQAQAPAFFRTTDLSTSIRRIHKLLCEPPSIHIKVRDYIVDRAQVLIGLVEEDPDAVLASTYLSTEIPDYRPGQQLLGAALAALLAPQCGFSDPERLSLVCAAMTRDVGLNDFDKTSSNYVKGLPPGIMNTVYEHTRISLNILKNHDVDDENWLRYVLEHHERPDGQGYPDGKSGQAISPGALLINLVDSYASMVLPSERSASKFPANALKELFLEKEKRYDERQIALLFKTLTRFPAGTLVSLANGEIGVVKATPIGNENLKVHSLYDRTGIPRSNPVFRDTSQPEFAVTGCVTPAKCKSAALVIRRLWQTTR